jgi:hypothetical protein
MNLRTRSLSLFSLVFLVAAVPGARADSVEVATKMATLHSAISAKGIRRCLNDPFLVRQIAQYCTRALDTLVDPVAGAKLALTEEETRVRKLACPSNIDYGCTADQIDLRHAADFLEEAVAQLSDAEKNAISDRREGKWWDRAFVKDNHLSVKWAVDFVTKAESDFENSATITRRLAP